MLWILEWLLHFNTDIYLPSKNSLESRYKPLDKNFISSYLIIAEVQHHYLQSLTTNRMFRQLKQIMLQSSSLWGTTSTMMAGNCLTLTINQLLMSTRSWCVLCWKMMPLVMWASVSPAPVSSHSSSVSLSNTSLTSRLVSINQSVLLPSPASLLSSTMLTSTVRRILRRQEYLRCFISFWTQIFILIID